MDSSERPKVYIHPVSFRLDDIQIQRALALRSSTPGNTWSESFRWLLDQPEVVEVIARRVNGN